MKQKLKWIERAMRAIQRGGSSLTCVAFVRIGKGAYNWYYKTLRHFENPNAGGLFYECGEIEDRRNARLLWLAWLWLMVKEGEDFTK